MFICAAAQILFVGMYGMWAILRPEDARATLPVFIATAWVLIVYNNWRPIWAYVRTWRR